MSDASGPETDELGGLEALIASRRSKLARLRDAGIDPFPGRTQRSHTSAEAHAAFLALEAEGETEGPEGERGEQAVGGRCDTETDDDGDQGIDQ